MMTGLCCSFIKLTSKYVLFNQSAKVALYFHSKGVDKQIFNVIIHWHNDTMTFCRQITREALLQNLLIVDLNKPEALFLFTVAQHVYF